MDYAVQFDTSGLAIALNIPENWAIDDFRVAEGSKGQKVLQVRVRGQNPKGQDVALIEELPLHSFQCAHNVVCWGSIPVILRFSGMPPNVIEDWPPPDTQPGRNTSA